jgi:pyrroline-5-carboxylate reductase
MVAAARSVLESGRYLDDLHDMAIAKRGPAVYGMHVLDRAGVKSGVTAAIEAAHKRAGELAESDGL